MKRLVWFAAGAAAGVGGTAYAKRKAREAADRYRPVSLAKGAASRVAEAVREGRSAMAAKEAELKARQDSDASGVSPTTTPPTTAPPTTTPPVPAVVEATAVEAGSRRAGPRRRSRR